MKQESIVPRLVDYIPSQLDDGVLYISQQYQTAIHKCCCGCGQEVVTPLSPAQWQITIAKNKVSLIPSIGNWNSECKSHYWIKQNRIVWSHVFTDHEIRRVQARDLRDLQAMTEHANLNRNFNPQELPVQDSNFTKSLWTTLVRFWKWIHSE